MKVKFTVEIRIVQKNSLAFMGRDTPLLSCKVKKRKDIVTIFSKIEETSHSHQTKFLNENYQKSSIKRNAQFLFSSIPQISDSS